MLLMTCVVCGSLILWKPRSEQVVWRKRILWAYFLAFVAAMFGGRTGREIPGGPFISVIGDVFPFAAALTAMGLGFTCLRERGMLPRLLAIVVMWTGAIVMGNVTTDVIAFWFRPYARGVFLGL